MLRWAVKPREQTLVAERGLSTTDRLAACHSVNVAEAEASPELAYTGNEHQLHGKMGTVRELVQIVV